MTQPLALPNYSALGSLVTEDDDYNTAKYSLQVAGWKQIGSGAETTVFLAPCGSRVLKVTWASSGQVGTLDAALAYPDNPHLPTIYGFLEGTDGALFIECERLEPASYDDRCSFEARDYIYSGGVTATGGHLDEIDELPDGPAKEALRALGEIAVERGLYWDAHPANVMVRPSDRQLVLNDALYA